MTVLHTGSTKKFSANWSNIFGGGKAAKAAVPAKSPASDDAKPAKKAATKAKAKPAKKVKPKK